MATITYVPSRLGEGFFIDVPVPASGDDDKALTYDHGTGEFVYVAFDAAGTAAAAVAAHVAAGDPHTQYELESNNTAAAILTKVLTVDGAGSGLDADLLDGNSSAAFLRTNGSSIGATAGAQIFQNTLECGSSTYATDGSVLVRARYNGAPAQALFTEYSSGAIGLSMYMFQNGSNTWLSSFSSSITRSALIVSQNEFKYMTAPLQNVSIGAPLTTQPTKTFEISNSGVMILAASSASPSTAEPMVYLRKSSPNATPTSGFGLSLSLEAECTYQIQKVGAVTARWNDPTWATRTGDVLLSVFHVSTEQFYLRALANSGGVQLGFYGATPVSCQTLATGAGRTIDDVITALQALGLVKQS